MFGDADYFGLPTSQRIVNPSEPGLRPVLRSLSHTPIKKMLSFDQLMKLGWRSLIPLALVNMLITGIVILWFTTAK